MTVAERDPERANELRRTFLERDVRPAVEKTFARHPELRSASFMLAQYWDDEADDAVHFALIFSILTQPDIAAASEGYWEEDLVNLPRGVSHDGLDRETELRRVWPDNGDAIPAFAAFCEEGSDQEMTIYEAYVPYALFERHGEEVEVRFVGTMLRPWLDGVPPASSSDRE